MAHCPYCGESISPGAVQCAKCGMMLDEDAAPAEVAASRGAGTGAGAMAAPAAKKKTEPCPKCDRPVPVTAHRCKACGHRVRDIVSEESRVAEATFQRNVKLGVLGAIAVVVVALLVIGIVRGSSGRPKNVDYAKIAYNDLATLVGPTSKATAARQKEHWIKYDSKFVRWDGRILEIAPAGMFGDGALYIRHRTGPASGASDADVRVAMPKSELEKTGVRIGAKVNYTGRLLSYGGSPGFELDLGQVVSTKE